MAIGLEASENTEHSSISLSRSIHASVIDRWIYVLTALFLIAIVLAGFVPDSLSKLAAIDAGRRPSFPPILHLHAVLMGSFLLLLLAQTAFVAIDKRKWHMTVGIVAGALVPAILITGVILVPTMYRTAWNAAVAHPSTAALRSLSTSENGLLLQVRAGLLFSIFMWIALRATTHDFGLHKRMIFLASTAALGAAIARIHFLPTTMPNSPLLLDIFTWLPIVPMFIWDSIRNHGIHRAYVIWAMLYFPISIFVHVAWNTSWWHASAQYIMGV